MYIVHCKFVYCTLYSLYCIVYLKLAAHMQVLIFSKHDFVYVIRYTLKEDVDINHAIYMVSVHELWSIHYVKHNPNI